MTSRRIRTILTASLISAATSFTLLGQPGAASAGTDDIPQEAPRVIVDDRGGQAPRSDRDHQEAPRGHDSVQQAPRTSEPIQVPRVGTGNGA
jgi:hypothetical protein